jgi:hypothetical protein
VIDLDTWTLINLKIDDLVALPYHIAERYEIDIKVLNKAVKNYAIQDIGILEFYRHFMSEVPRAPVALAPSTCHYSWPKAGTLLSRGSSFGAKKCAWLAKMST